MIVCSERRVFVNHQEIQYAISNENGIPDLFLL